MYFVPNTSENNNNMFLQQLKELLSQSFLYEEVKGFTQNFEMT